MVLGAEAEEAMTGWQLICLVIAVICAVEIAVVCLTNDEGDDDDVE
jgi:hypothetical protein